MSKRFALIVRHLCASWCASKHRASRASGFFVPLSPRRGRRRGRSEASASDPAPDDCDVLIAAYALSAANAKKAWVSAWSTREDSKKASTALACSSRFCAAARETT